MKTSIAVAAVLIFVARMLANPVPTRPFPVRLAGEAVEVQLLSDVAVVSGVYQFDRWYTRDQKLMYLPVFARDGDAPERVLARSKIEFELGGQNFESIAASEPPIRVGPLPSGLRVQWFVVNIDEETETGVGRDGDARTVRITYEQPLVQGIFYYLPVIAGPSVKNETGRAWHFQMHAVAKSHALRVLSQETDYETVAGGVVVFLRDGSVVALK